MCYERIDSHRVAGREQLTTKANTIATKIVCTIGPASDSSRVLTQLIQSGMDVARINFSHGTYDQHVLTIKTIRQVSERLRRPVAIFQDLPGPKLRVGKLATEPLHLQRLDKISLTSKPTNAKSKIPIAYPDLPKAVKKGDTIFLADGTIRIEVLQTKKDEVEGRVINGGDLTSGKGVNLPRLRIRVPAITGEDREHIKFGLENKVDIIAVSFVQKVDDIRAARRVAEETERFLPKEISAQRRGWYEHGQADALALGACETALQVSASAIVAPTRTGRTARLVSKYRPPLPIIALTSHPEVQRQLLLSWGVQALLTKEFNTSEEIFGEAEKTVVRTRLARKGDRIVIIAGDPKGPSGKTEIVKVQTIS